MKQSRSDLVFVSRLCHDFIFQVLCCQLNFAASKHQCLMVNKDSAWNLKGNMATLKQFLLSFILLYFILFKVGWRCSPLYWIFILQWTFQPRISFDVIENMAKRNAYTQDTFHNGSQYYIRISGHCYCKFQIVSISISFASL